MSAEYESIQTCGGCACIFKCGLPRDTILANEHNANAGRAEQRGVENASRRLFAFRNSVVLGDSDLAEVILRGDFETGTLEQWKGGAPKSDSVKIVQDPVREGKYAVRIDGTNAARKGTRDRIEFQHQPDPPGTAEGTERYFGWSVYLPKKLDRRHARDGIFRDAKAGTS